MRNLFYLNFIVVTVLLLDSSELISQEVLAGVNDESINDPYKYPWAGGINAVQYCEVDLNLDGIMDLLVFDKRGNRKMCFTNKGTSNIIDYTYEPSLAEQLPEFYDWVIFADYNMDGKKDIFTYSPGYASMMVYKNVSDNILKFERVVYPYLKTKFPGGKVNLYVTNADYPGIADVDNDGDLDILTFGVLGSFIDLHKNMSMEKYGIPDSLDYEHYTYCWGRVAENDESNQLILDTCVGGGYSIDLDFSKKERHTGSTFMVHDIDNNGLVDILLGDVDYPQLYALYNFGTIEEALITKVDTIFPGNTNAVDLFSMPCAAYIDVNNDNIKDLLVSPFDPGISTSSNKESSWLYLNSGSNTLPQFEIAEEAFLQNNMIDLGSGAYPVLFDWNSDGLIDLFVGNYGYYWYSYYNNYTLHSVFNSQMAYFKNVGTINNPVFQLWETNFAELSNLQKQSLLPTFQDIDGDGYTDLLLGSNTGEIIYVRNLQNGDFEIVNLNYFDIDVGEYSSPQLFDLDNDGLKDLIIGERAGNINYYHNDGIIGSPNFVYVTDSLGKINITDYSISWDGYSTPSFFRLSNQITDLVVGSEQGDIFYFTDIDNNLDGKFNKSDQIENLLDTSGVNFDRGMRTAALITNLFYSNKTTMLVGNYSGGLELFNGNSDVNSGLVSLTYNEHLNIYPSPAQEYIYIKLPEVKSTIQVSIYNLNGQKLLTQSFRNLDMINMDIGSLDNGYYMLQANTESNVFVNRIVIIN